MIPGVDEVEIRLIYGCRSCNAAEQAVREECGCMITVCWPGLKTCIENLYAGPPCEGSAPV